MVPPVSAAAAEALVLLLPGDHLIKIIPSLPAYLRWEWVRHQRQLLFNSEKPLIMQTQTHPIVILVETNIRAVDITACWGGEEVTILMPQSDAAEKQPQEITHCLFKQVGTLTVRFYAAG